jgi:prolyl 4-hydroxylase
LNTTNLLPTDNDYTGAIKAIHRLDDTYLLNATSIRLGSLNARYPSRPLTAFECFELGRIAYNDKDYYHSIIWMSEALEQSEAEEIKSVDKFQVLDYLSFSTYKV